MLNIPEDARGCPNIDVSAAFIALCGDRFCSSLAAAGVATRLDADGRGQKHNSKNPPFEGTARAKDDKAIRAVNFPPIPRGDYDIATTVQASFPNGQIKTREQHTRFTMPAALAEISNPRVLPQDRTPNKSKTAEIAMDVKAQEPGDYELVMVLIPEARLALTVRSTQHFEDTASHRMVASLPKDGLGTYSILSSRLDRLEQEGHKRVCVAYRRGGGNIVIEN